MKTKIIYVVNSENIQITTATLTEACKQASIIMKVAKEVTITKQLIEKN
jgi:hypothetical protein